MKTLNIIIIAMLWSLSPAGESKVGIPYAIYNDINIYIAFLFCFCVLKYRPKPPPPLLLTSEYEVE